GRGGSSSPQRAAPLQLSRLGRAPGPHTGAGAGLHAACNAAATPRADPRNPDGSRTSRHHTEESVVPLINVKVIEGVFDGEQKQQIVRSLTEAMVAIEGENMRSVTWCVVEEVESGDWAIGGKPVTTSDVKALAAGVPM